MSPAKHYQSPPPHDGCAACDALSIVVFMQTWLNHARRPLPKAAGRQMTLDEEGRVVIGELTVDTVENRDGLIVVTEHGNEAFAFDADKIHKFEPCERVTTLATVLADLHRRYGASADRQLM
jgi:hypothetical protein